MNCIKPLPQVLTTNISNIGKAWRRRRRTTELWQALSAACRPPLLSMPAPERRTPSALSPPTSPLPPLHLPKLPSSSSRISSVSRHSSRDKALCFEAPLLRKLADNIAAAGYYVVVPDYFNKDPFVPASGGDPLATLGDWLKNRNPLDGLEGTKQAIEGLKKEGFLSVGAVGFCWGAKVVVELGKEHVLKATVLCHPGYVTVEDIRDVKTPIAILAAEIDQITPPALAKQFIEILESKTEVESFARIYPGVAHGWTTRYDTNDKTAVEKAEEAHAKILEWFGKFLI